MRELVTAWFFPRSLRQLVLLAFLLVLLPLLILAYQAYQSLDRLSDQAAEINRTTLTDVRRGEAMTAKAVEMERSYRQYCVLGDPRLQQLYREQYQEYVTMLAAQVLPNDKSYPELQSLIRQLTELKCQDSQPQTDAAELLSVFSYANDDLIRQMREQLFSRGETLQDDIAQQGQIFGGQALGLFLVSLLMVFLFTRMIIRPVKAIENMVNRLGAGKNLDANLKFQGPNELRSLGLRIIWLSERLAWLESQRHEFLRHLSHELKTPLASMREGTELLADQVVGPLTQEQQEVVTILDDSSRHLQQLIEQLLNYNRRLTSSAEPCEEVQLSETIADVMAAHSLLARSKTITIACDLLVDSCQVERKLLTSVLDNLYSNAIHYGAEFGNIWISSRQLGTVLQIDVANSGEAISLAEQGLIFEPFYQGSQQRKGAVKGSGLGLSIALDCVRRMNGELSLVKVDYADVCFRIELPLNTKNKAEQIKV